MDQALLITRTEKQGIRKVLKCSLRGLKNFENLEKLKLLRKISFHLLPSLITSENNLCSNHPGMYMIVNEDEIDLIKVTVIQNPSKYFPFNKTS